MMKPVQISLQRTDGSKLDIIVMPIIAKGGERGLLATGLYKIYSNAAGDNDHLLIETAYLDQIIDEQNDAPDPNYLGQLQFDGNNWVYSGDLLTVDEQDQITAVISSYDDDNY